MAIERRRHERVDFFCRVLLDVHPSGPSIEANTIDASIGGVGVMTEGTLEKDQFVTVTFFLRDESQTEIVDKVAGRVANVKHDLAIKRVGIEFLQLLHESEHPELTRKIMAI